MVGWNNLKYYSPRPLKHKTTVTIIVPFYNEAEKVANALTGLLNQSIENSDFTILAVNDNSTDQSVSIVEQLTKNHNRLQLLHNTGKGKKEAIANGVASCVSELIITTDADCTYPEKWLETMVSYYEQHRPGMIIGPVVIENNKGLFSRFQTLEFNSLIMSTGGAAGIGHPVMCNGANLAFKRELFQQINDPLNDEYLSGDDVFLLHSIKRETDEEIHFLKSHHAMVSTSPAESLSQFIKQRERWTSKAPGYTDADTVFSASIVLGINALLFVGMFLMLFNLHYIKPMVFLYMVKLFADFFFFNSTDSFFKHRMYFINLVVFEFVYVFYVVFVTAKGLLNRNKWKKEKAHI